MDRSIVAGALVLALGCGDSAAQEGSTSTGGGTGASESASTTSGGASSGPTGSDSTDGSASEAGTTAESPTSGATAVTSEGSSETDEPAANCYESGIITSVAELTAAKLQGYNCITGDVWISEGTGPDLWFLSEIRSIGGYLRIMGPHSLVSLHGLEKLESVGGPVEFGETPELLDASALAGLVSVGGDLEFRDAPKLTALDLGVLTTLKGELHVSAPLASLNVTGLTNLPGGLDLEHTNLTTLAGLSGVTSIGGLRLYHNAQLVDLSGLEALVQLNGRLEIDHNAALVSLDGLPALTTVSPLEVRNNNKLATLAPLAGATVASVLVIAGNAALTSLPPLKGEVGHLEVSSNPALVGLAGLEGVTATNRLEINFNDKLVDLQGLGAVVDDLEIVTIRGNDGLQTLDGSSGPVTVAEMTIFDNPQLKSLGLLKSLQSATWLNIVGTNVQALPELAGLTSIERVQIDQNSALTSLAGLENLASVASLRIRDNPELTTIAALQDGALVEVTEVYDVSGNALLPSCTAKALYDSLKPPPADFCYDNMIDMCSGLGGCVVEPMP